MACQEDVISWINEKLSELLDFSVPAEMIQYICLIENERDFKEFFSTLLDFNNPAHVEFIQKLQKRLMKGSLEKNQELERLIPKSIASKDKQASVDTSKKEQKKRGKNLSPENDILAKEKNTDKSKKKPNFVNLYSQEGQAKDVILLKGRHSCTCEASKHSLVNNCLMCGRIVCEQEGAGPCLFCGSLVCSPEQQKLLNTGSKRSEKLHQHLMKQRADEALQKRDQLLEYDRTGERLTRVIDDESDYYTPSSVWLSDEERKKVLKREQELYDQQHASRRDKKFTIDFFGRQVVEEAREITIDPLNDPVLMKISQTVFSPHRKRTDDDENEANPSFAHPLFIEGLCDRHINPNSIETKMLNIKSRVQDKELQEMSDQAMCLSMHQPWASLLIEGIKVHEGRSWFTSHRGILWIAAAAKMPSKEEIQEQESIHRILADNPRDLKFPLHYPTGCLLGCVSIADCLPQEEYREQFPEGASESPFVFICENPQKLPICFPMKGKHKIFKLESKIHQAAQKSLKRVAKLQAEKEGN